MAANLTPGRKKVINIKTSVSVIAKVMREAEASGLHTAGSWWDEGALHHARHALSHFENASAYLDDDPSLGFSESEKESIKEELEHALCRAAMAMTCFRFGEYGDNGNEGRNK